MNFTYAKAVHTLHEYRDLMSYLRVTKKMLTRKNIWLAHGAIVETTMSIPIKYDINKEKAISRYSISQNPHPSDLKEFSDWVMLDKIVNHYTDEDLSMDYSYEMSLEAYYALPVWRDLNVPHVTCKLLSRSGIVPDEYFTQRFD